MASTVEEHFEDRPRMSRKSRLLLVFGIFGLIALVVVFALSTLPSRRAEFIGSWVGKNKARAYIVLFADGHYNACLPLNSYDPSRADWLVTVGSWSASHDALYLEPYTMTPDGAIKDKYAYQRAKENMVRHEMKLQVRWNSKSEWYLDEFSDNPFVPAR